MSDNNISNIMPPVAPSYILSDGKMPPLAPPYEQEQTFNRLMDSVHRIRTENEPVVKGTIEIPVDIYSKPGGQPEYVYHPAHLNLEPKPDEQPIKDEERENHREENREEHRDPYLYQYPNPEQCYPQYQNPYQYQSPYQYYTPYQYQNPYPILYSNPYSYANLSHYPRLANQYSYRYPTANAVGSIAGGISQLIFAADLLKRRY